ncbi:Crp/Fnr family transcriptional regulator [Halobacteriales archaeon QS_1_68_17]|nr:MAG: Crp/Fnr family transcriptional regulator [Halobacteriales archaeon QS_1_68_17]
MAKQAHPGRDLSVLRSKRAATKYQILVEIAERQPAVNQGEIADQIGVSPQAVSDYLQDLLERGHVHKHGRGRYEVTKEGVDWLISRTDDLSGYTRYVSEEVIGQVDIETAIATAEIDEGQPVSLSMHGGVLRATPGATGEATAVAVTDAAAGTDVGVTDFEGILDHEPGAVTVLSVPAVQDGGSRAVDPSAVASRAADHQLVAAADPESLAAARAADVDPDASFGTEAVVAEAATKGLDVLLLSTPDRLSAHTDRLREHNVSYEVVDGAA